MGLKNCGWVTGLVPRHAQETANSGHKLQTQCLAGTVANSNTIVTQENAKVPGYIAEKARHASRLFNVDPY